jgi:hypothetical protein
MKAQTVETLTLVQHGPTSKTPFSFLQSQFTFAVMMGGQLQEPPLPLTHSTMCWRKHIEKMKRVMTLSERNCTQEVNN